MIMKEMRWVMGDNTLNYYYAQYNRPPRQYKGFDLLQIGTAYCKPQIEVAEHAHDKYFELTAVLSGEGVIFTNNVSVPVSKGDIFVSFPYDTHAIKAGQMGMDYNFVSFYLKDELLLSEFERLAIMYGKPCDRVVRSETLGTLIVGAISETLLPSDHHEPYLEAVFVQLLIQLLRTFKKQSVPSSVPGKREELCYRVMDYINSHIYSMRSLTELSEHFRYDYAYLSKIFTKTTSKSISEYYSFRRLETARELIGEGGRSISDIAEMLGYSSIYPFSKAFKRQYGVSPREYKKGKTDSFVN